MLIAWASSSISAGDEPILDQLSVSAAAAYSLRQVRSGVALAIRVRRSSDNAEADIGFATNGDLDTAALLAHVGSGNGFVTTWYDQSGNARNATQPTAGSQPQIVASGAIETQNGRPALRFDGVNDFFVMTSPINSANATINAVSRLASMGVDGGYILGSLTPLGVLGYDDGSLGLRIFSSSGGYFASPLPAAVILAAAVDTIVIASNVAALHRYGVSIAGTRTIGQNFQPTNIGTYGNGTFGRFWSGTLSETTVFGSSISTTDRQTLERNEGSYYSITVD